MGYGRAHLYIQGRVQGVFFRGFTRERAQDLGLNGWVKNLRDGRVEALFEGEKALIEKAIEACNIGPLGARVTDIDIQWEAFVGEQEGFHIRY